MVAACAANETPRISATQRRGRLGAGPASRAVMRRAPREDPCRREHREAKPRVVDVSGIEQQQDRARPAERRRGGPGSPQLSGEQCHARHRRRRERPTASGPTNSTYTTIASAVSTARRRRCIPPASAPSVDATIAMFQPEIATTWLAPAVVNAAARSRSTRSRSPISTPAASPASGSGIDRSMPSAAARRNPSSVRLMRSLRRQHLERFRAQRAHRADPGEVRAVVILRGRPDATAELDAIVRDDRRIPRQRRGHEHRRLGLEADGRRPAALARRADGLDDADPRAVTGRDRRRAPDAGRPRRHAGRSRATPIASGASQRGIHVQRPARPAPAARASAAPTSETASGDSAASASAPAAAPTASQAGLGTAQPTEMSGLSFSNVFSPTRPRSRSSSIVLEAATRPATR